MRNLSEYQNEEALDLLVELIEPITNILADKEVSEAYKGGKTKMQVIAIAIKNHKQEVLSILAALDGVPVEEYKCNILSIPVKCLQIVNDKELVSFFKSQERTEEQTSFTPAMENTEASEQ